MCTSSVLLSTAFKSSLCRVTLPTSAVSSRNVWRWNPRNREYTSTMVRHRFREYLHGYRHDEDRTVEGVSPKQFPVLISWRRPRHVLRHVQHRYGSGDLQGLPDLSPGEPLPLLANEKPDKATNCFGLDARLESKLDSASDDVRRLLSLEFGRKRDRNELVKRIYKNSVQRHRFDTQSIELRVALLTARIRFLQEEIGLRDERNAGIQRHVCKILVDHRMLLLGKLREYDYAKFEMVLERLNIVYRPKLFKWERVERKKHLRRLTDLWCSELKQYRLDELKQQNREQQPAYLREKANTLKWIREEEEKLDMEPTVSQDEIDECLRSADALEAEEQKRKEQKDEGFEYHVFQPDSANTKKILGDKKLLQS